MLLIYLSIGTDHVLLELLLSIEGPNIMIPLLTDDPMDPVILCLGAVVLVPLPPVVVQVSNACLTNTEVHCNWFYIYKNIIHLAPPLLKFQSVLTV